VPNLAQTWHVTPPSGTSNHTEPYPGKPRGEEPAGLQSQVHSIDTDILGP